MINPLQLLYDSEINYEISCFWDSGFRWKLGDSRNGYKAEGYAKSFNLTVVAIWNAAKEYYPDADLIEKAIQRIVSKEDDESDARIQ